MQLQGKLCAPEKKEGRYLGKKIEWRGGRFKGTVSLVDDGLKLVLLDGPWLKHKAPTVLKIFNCPFYYLPVQAFEVLKRLIPNPFEFANCIMNVDSK
jgi:hypothetical protein